MSVTGTEKRRRSAEFHRQLKFIQIFNPFSAFIIHLVNAISFTFCQETMNKSSTDPFSSGVLRYPLPPLSAEEKAQLKSMFRDVSTSRSYSSSGSTSPSTSVSSTFLKPLDEDEREGLRVLNQKSPPTLFELIMGKRN